MRIWSGINLHYLMLYNEPVKCRLQRGSGHTGGDMYDRIFRSIQVNALNGNRINNENVPTLYKLFHLKMIICDFSQ